MEDVCKRFDTEYEVTRNVRHRNLVSVITTCSSDYIRAFVLQFMSNGSLENWLYKEDRHLNLHQRVTVMLDVAMAIEYLHHGHVTPIVHCDLKPANVLLDEDMMAHVGDLGISKILAISKSMAYTETLGTLGYIAPVVKNLLIFWPMIGPKILIFALGLVVLNLENNNFHGGIPYGLGEMPRLKVIDVKNNQLSGSIPTSLFQNQRVQVISLVFNELSGEMWRGPWYVPKLRVLNLWNNSLTGIVPPSVGNATKMMNFSMSGNRVSGNIPKEIGNMSQLVELFLFDNQLTGFIPPTLFNISSLLSVSLANNSLSGSL
ncbi:probable leucine-rich repeat receptor-like protein kinase At1g35710 [Solanum verrucosum]|uniref:probable leucine-rich repeat receptor-like protein kinase At1g35710 n=1 Tax=Solanum verrucosum TaxID=315347 RepID=UPI0020CFF01D|nr:probable leucine-rich repeat receptor-like protein kinase At1g35710 [Solanum verrucosum]